VQLGLDLLVQGLVCTRQDAPLSRAQRARFGVHDLVLFLDADGEIRRFQDHDAVLSSSMQHFQETCD